MLKWQVPELAPPDWSRDTVLESLEPESLTGYDDHVQSLNF